MSTHLSTQPVVSNGQHPTVHHGSLRTNIPLWLPPHLNTPQANNSSPSASPVQPTPKIRNTQWAWLGLGDKALWDWLSLLFVPLLVGVGTIAVMMQQNSLSEQQHQNDQNIARQTRSDDLLKAYRDGIDTLLLSSNLRAASQDSDVRRVARSRTLDILRQVDATRKGFVIAYLADLGLVQGGSFDNKAVWHPEDPVISLRGTDLSGTDLHGIDLAGAALFEADLRGADLFEADLRVANLTEADLSGVRLTGADLGGADLTEANLRVANLTEADLDRARLTRTDLFGANLFAADLFAARNLTADQLAQASDLTAATMPNGKRFCNKEEESYC